MLPERTSTKLTDTHKNNKRNLCNWVSLYPSLPSPLPDYLNKASLFGGQKLLGELMFFGRERMLLWSLSRSCQHHRYCSSAYLLLLWSHTQHGHNTQYTTHTHPHTRGTHCYHTQVIIVKPSQTKHDLLNGSIPFNLFPINWKKSNGQCTISQVAKRERVQEREGYRGEWRSNKTRKGRLHFSRVLWIVSCFPTPTCFFASWLWV